MSCSRTQRSGAVEARTLGLESSTLPLSHCASNGWEPGKVSDTGWRSSMFLGGGGYVRGSTKKKLFNMAVLECKKEPCVKEYFE